MRTTLWLLVASMTIAMADYPQFCDTEPCNVILRDGSRYQQRLYVHIPYGTTMKRTINVKNMASFPDPVPVSAYVPLKYDASTFTISLLGGAATVGATPNYYPYFQTVEYPIENVPGLTKDTTVQPFTVEVNAGDVTKYPHGFNIMFKLDAPYVVTALEIVAMPIPQWKTHAYWWTQQMYYYIWIAVTAPLAVLYGVFARCRIWQWALVFSIASFTAVAAENFYHACLAGTRGGSLNVQAYCIVCIVLLANIIPALVAMLFMRYGKCHPIQWSILAILVGTGFLFLAGPGWFVGCGLLIVAAFVRILQRLAYCSLAVVS